MLMMIELPITLRYDEMKEGEEPKVIEDLKNHTLTHFKEQLQEWAVESHFDKNLIGTSALDQSTRRELINKFNLEIKICQLQSMSDTSYFSMAVIHYTNKDAAGKILFGEPNIKRLVLGHGSVTVDIFEPPLEYVPDLVMLFLRDKADPISTL